MPRRSPLRAGAAVALQVAAHLERPGRTGRGDHDLAPTDPDAEHTIRWIPEDLAQEGKEIGRHRCPVGLRGEGSLLLRSVGRRTVTRGPADHARRVDRLSGMGNGRPAGRCRRSETSLSGGTHLPQGPPGRCISRHRVCLPRKMTSGLVLSHPQPGGRPTRRPPRQRHFLDTWQPASASLEGRETRDRDRSRSWTCTFPDRRASSRSSTRSIGDSVPHGRRLSVAGRGRLGRAARSTPRKAPPWTGSRRRGSSR